MSRRRPPWSILGIDRTGNERTIKRAYAKKLKDIDVEAEPAKFIALRKTYDEALRQARWIDDDGQEDEVFGGAPDDMSADGGPDETPQAEEPGGEDGTVWAADGVPFVPEPSAMVPPPARPEQVEERAGEGDAVWAPDGRPFVPGPSVVAQPQPEPAGPWSAAPEVDRVEVHFAAIEAVLNGAPETREAGLDRAMRALWAEPALDTVDAADDAELRLAHLALDYGADAEFLLRLASWHYGWSRRAQLVGTGWPISEVGARAAAENWFQKILAGETYNQKAAVFSDLQAPPSGRWWRDYRAKRRIAAFLPELRRRFPEGEYRFDSDIVEAWEAPSRYRTPWTALVLAFLVALGMTGETGEALFADPLFWLWWPGGTAALVAIGWLLRRRAERRRHDPALNQREVAAYAGVLLALPLAIFAPETVLATLFLAAASIFLTLESGGTPDADSGNGLWARLMAARYPIIAGAVFVVHAIGGTSDSRQAVVPVMLALLTTHWLRHRLVASWEKLPSASRTAVRVVLMCGAAALLWSSVAVLPALPGRVAVGAGILILLVQDAAVDAYRRPFATPFLIAYVLLASALITMPLTVGMALVVRRTIDRLFVKA